MPAPPDPSSPPNGPASPEDRAALVAHFHALIARTVEGRLPVPHPLPDPYAPEAQQDGWAWFPVPGMYGGFAYRWRDAHTLEAKSWSRVVQGSGRRHLVTAEGAELVETGFV